MRFELPNLEYKWPKLNYFKSSQSQSSWTIQTTSRKVSRNNFSFLPISPYESANKGSFRPPLLLKNRDLWGLHLASLTQSPHARRSPGGQEDHQIPETVIHPCLGSESMHLVRNWQTLREPEVGLNIDKDAGLHGQEESLLWREIWKGFGLYMILENEVFVRTGQVFRG